MKTNRALHIIFIHVLFFSVNVAPAQNLTRDLELGREQAQKIEQIFGVYEDPEMERYVKSVGNRLVSAMDDPLFEYSFKIISTPIPNAFALPGGYTYVTTGLLPILESEHELACIMAHEIIHADNRHAIKSMKRGVIPAILQLPGNIIGVFSPGAGEMLNRPIRGFGDLGMASYSRKNETEADVRGIELASKAGYDPEALQSALKRLGKYMEMLTGQKEEKGYLDDHPMTDDRIKKLKKKVSKIEFATTNPISPSFNHEFQGILYGENPSRGVVIDSIFYHPEYNFKITVPDGWVSQIGPDIFAMMDTAQRASVYIHYSKSDSTPQQMASLLEEKLPDSYKQIMVVNQEVYIHDEPAYMMAFEKDAGDKTFAFMLWYKKDSTIFEFSAMARAMLRPAIEQVPYTLNSLNDDDRNKITVERLELVTANENESIEDFSKRINNTLSADITALINNLTAGKKLDANRKLKVVLQKPYFSK